ncbi:MAG: Crp/Fnr family transcriptional regulator [Anaerorhabdus sp.]|uniref:Crp/Fnr family transcriptional regulator n=2 Tax=Anaerorhabdus sp. TaxID=1872524 RepID=UPI002FC6B2CA
MSLESTLFLQQNKKRMKISKDCYQKIKLFNGIDFNTIPELLELLDTQEVYYKKNTILYNQGDQITNIGIVISGSLQISSCDFFGNKSILTELNEGDTFGEVFALAKISTVPLQVIATQDSHILLIHPDSIFDTKKLNPLKQKFIQLLLMELTRKNLTLSKKIEHLTKRSIREKLYSYLSSEAIRNKSSHFTIPFNRQELADYLSIDRSACSSELSSMKQEGILDYHKNEFTLHKKI